MELEYIHEHPLIFYEAQKDAQSLDLCDGCGEEILGPAYRCSQECLFHLHRLCAELPEQINYNQHPQHPLILLIKPRYRSSGCICDVCDGGWDKFTYHCSHCQFDLCISCALVKELDYHSHEHPLFLYEVGMGDAQSLDLCHGCGNGILGPAYHCSQQQCFFYLHKICAELPKKINHTSHLQHSLNLFIKPPYYSQTCECDVCQDQWETFTYNCSGCDFNLCISCVLGKERRIKHESHEHPLDLLQRPTLFQCDACDTKSEDISYICTVCSFRIHKGCASLQSTIKNSDHDHPLTLAYSFPGTYLKLCKICSLRVRPEHWVYYCDICNYYAHVKCATSKLEHVSLRSLPRAETLQNGKDTAQVNSSDQQLIEQDDASDNGKNIGSAEQSDTAGTNSGKKSTEREPEITREDLQKHFGRKLDDVAESFGVSRSTFKRICRENGISQWPRRKIGKVNDSLSMQDPPPQDGQATVAHTRLSAAVKDGRTDIESRFTSHPPLVDHSSDLIQECVTMLEKIEGINWTVYSKTLTKLHDDHTWRKIFLAMSAHRRKEWVLSL